MFGKLFGGNKSKSKKGFFLELDEKKDNQPENKKTKESPKPVDSKKSEPVPAKTSVAKSEAKKPEPTKTESPKTNKTKSTELGWDAPDWVKDMYNTSNGNKPKAQEPEETFAPDNLMPAPSGYRRRPGPSMKMFMGMARQVKTPTTNR